MQRAKTPFVGRLAERQLLVDRCRLTLEGQGQVMVVYGEPGIGKSRLVEQLRIDVPSTSAWITVGGERLHAQTPFHLIRGIVAAALELTSTESADPLRRLDDALTVLGPDAADGAASFRRPHRPARRGPLSTITDVA